MDDLPTLVTYAQAGDPQAHETLIQRLYKEKRARVGPVYGELFYFPGW